MTLSAKQAKFTKMVALLILYIEECGHHVTFGDAYAFTGHKMDSLHYKRLAIDLNLFNSKGNYLTSTRDHEKFGLFWESIGGSWGGRFDDGNHYSLEYGGMK